MPMILSPENRPKPNLKDISITDGFIKGANNSAKRPSNLDVEEKIKAQKMEFFTLLTAQLKNQDPSEPMDTNQMTQNIFTMNMVEQQLETNKLLQNVASSTERSIFLESASYIGKKLVYEGDKTHVDANKALLEFNAAGVEDETAEVQIIDPKSRDIKFKQEVQLKNGLNTVILDLKNKAIADGIYEYNVVVDETSKSKTNIKKFSNGIVTGVIPMDEEYKFEINGDIISMKKVLKIDGNLNELKNREVLLKEEGGLVSAKPGSDSKATEVGNDMLKPNLTKADNLAPYRHHTDPRFKDLGSLNDTMLTNHYNIVNGNMGNGIASK